jgi:hypothetical protein
LRITVERRVGRLVEVRCTGNPTEADVALFRTESAAVLTACVARLRRNAIACPDFRGATLLRPIPAEQIIQLMGRHNRSVDRSAILLSNSATFTLQVSRIIRESAGAKLRRVFTEVEPLVLWLDEVLEPDEQTRLREFIAEYDPSAQPLDPITMRPPRP